MAEQKHLIEDQQQLISSANRSLALRVLPGTFIYVVLFSINVFANSYHLERPILVGIAGSLLILIGLYRFALFIWFEQLHHWNSRLWLIMFYIGTLGVAAVWSLAWSLAIIQDGLVPTTNLSIMMTIGITGAGVATLAPAKKLVIYFLLLMLIPIPIAVVISGANEAIPISIMLLIGILFLLSVGTRLNKEYWQGLTNLSLLDQRARDLARAHEAAVVADRAKSEFLAKMSHEVRTPMNGVLGMTELLMNTQLNERQQHLANSIHNSGRLLLDVINDVLDFSKLDAGKIELEKTFFDLREELEQQIEMFAEPAHRKGIELISFIPGDLPSKVIGDPLRLRQVLANLIGNALKFTEQGEVVVRVYPIGSVGDPLEFRFEVEDTGIGVSSTAQTHIFDSFTQADDSTTRKYGGSGLGLAIAKQLTELLGGKIGVENPTAGGARFWFTAKFTPQQNAVLSADVHSLKSRYRHILLVVNNAKSRLVLAEMLALPDLKIGTAACGKEALEMLTEASKSGRPYDAAIMDACLPDMESIELIHAINRHQATASLDMLILVRINTELDSERLQSGNCTLKRKPLRYKTLLSFLQYGPQPDRNPASPKQHSTSYSKHLPVLLAEDNLVNQEVASAMLEILGYQVEIAKNGQEALNQLKNGQYSLVLMDCQMPVVDGYQATRSIREQESIEQTERLPIIAMTASALKGDREAALAAGMDDYLAKPFTKDQLSEMLLHWVVR